MKSMKSKLNKQEKGFTIIEVLIVLAIAGLIILIVFLAVPALQRNSRNTQRKNDVASIGGALTEYVNNNNGNLPTTCTGATPCPFYQNSKASLYNLSSATTTFTYSPTTPVAPAAVTNVETLKIYNYTKCNPAVIGGTVTTNATKRSLVALYAVETGNGFTSQCQEL
jgi:prepilin-type N-terminal cleavage/methylation domain-containing protein